MICIHCEIEFDPRDKRRQALLEGRPMGRINECIDCAESDVVRVTGVMLPGNDGAGAGDIQINSNPELTKFLNIRRGHGNTHSFDNTDKKRVIYNRGKNGI